MGLHRYTVVGLTDDITSPDGEPVVFLSLPDAQEVLFQRDNEDGAEPAGAFAPQPGPDFQ